MSVRVKPWPPGMASGGVSLSPQSFLSSPRRWIAWRASAADGRQATASGVVGAPRDAVRAVAEAHGACLHPVQLRRINTETGEIEQVLIPCGATLASKCPPCAEG